jgi:hypothetical protein
MPIGGPVPSAKGRKEKKKGEEEKRRREDGPFQPSKPGVRAGPKLEAKLEPASVPSPEPTQERELSHGGLLSQPNSPLSLVNQPPFLFLFPELT